MIYIVLGMHKSGTSLIAETLHKSGINMVELPEEYQDYKKGLKHERQSTSEINKEILRGDVWDSMRDIPTHTLLPSVKKRMEEVIAKCNKESKDWGFKDPRTCLTYHYWKNMLPTHKIVAIYRNPAQVISHVFASCRRPDKKLIRGFKSISNWKTYNQLLLDIVRAKGSTDALLLNYEDFMSSQQAIDKLANFTGKPINDARKKDHFNFREQHHPLLNFDIFSEKKISSLYGELEDQKEKI
ncbi:MAG: sulfotransferase [Bacteroidota bacterium]